MYFTPLGGCTALHCTAPRCTGAPDHTECVVFSLTHAEQVQVQKWREGVRVKKPGVLTSRCVCLKDDSRWEGPEQKCGAAPESILASFLHQSPRLSDSRKTVLGLDKTHQSGDTVCRRGGYYWTLFTIVTQWLHFLNIVGPFVSGAHYFKAGGITRLGRED